ncbi:hypothetical protein Angca_006674, partial [Angiostrongylus cantonensis]
MANPYACDVHLDELGPDHTIIDFAFISEENFLLVVLLASSGVNDCLLTPTCIRCFVTKNPPRPLLVFSNKAGSIMFVDLSSRKCVAELNAPQSIHEVEILQSKDNAEVILTSFTGAQWIIPLESGDRGVTEVLTSCIPSEFKKVEPASSHLSGNTEGVVLLNSVENFAELYDVLPCVGAPPKKRFKV